MSAARTYRFAPLDRGGWLLGLSGGQCLLLASGLFGAGLLLRAGVPAPAVAVPLLLALGLAFAPVDGGPAYAHAALVLGWGRTRRQRIWSAPVPLFSAAGEGRDPVPPAFGALSLIELPRPAWAMPAVAGVGAVLDHDAGSLSATVAVSAVDFPLAPRADQDRAVAGWGDVLAAFSTERGRVARLAVTEWAAPAGVAAARAWLARHGRAAPDTSPRAAYEDLCEVVAAQATAHEVLVTVTVEERRLRSRSAGRGRIAAGDALLDELAQLTSRLEAAGLAPSPPLSPAELATAIRARLDPGCRPRLEARAATLADGDGLRPPAAWPLSMQVAWDHVAADASVHSAWWVAEWPRLEVGPAWLEPLLTAPGVTRSLVFYLEPVAPSAARRRIERDATRLATDAEARAQRGFRVGARHRRAEAAVAEREAELVSGYAEVGLVGLLVVSAADHAALDAAGATAEAAAATAGLELRRLDGRHDLALALAAPLGRPIGTPRLT